MKNLMTRKIVLGMLMVLVLAFSVQGTADAIDTASFALSGGTDLGNLIIGETVPLTLTATTDIPTHKESIILSASGGSARISVDGADEKTSHTFTEDDADLTDGSDVAFSIGTLVLTVRSAGEVTVRLRDNTSVPSGDSRASEQVLTFYVVKDRLDVSLSDTIRLRGVTNGVGHPYDHRGDIQIYNGDSRHNRVTYTLHSDFNSGALYVKEGNRARFGNDSLETSSAAQVWLSMGARTALNTALTAGGTNLVTVEVNGNGNETTAVYIYGRPRLDVTVDADIDAEDDTTSPDGSEIDDAFIARILDESSDAGAAVPNVPVRFDVKDKTITGGRLFQAADSTIVDSSNREISNPTQGVSTLYVRTPRAATPAAEVNFQLGSASRKQVVSVSALGKSEDVTAYANVEADRTLTLIGRQRRGTSNLYDLKVEVKDDGVPVPSVEVSFNAIKGSVPAQATTDRTGQARVVYDSDGESGTLEVVARAPKTGTDVDAADIETIKLTINVSGGSVTRREDPDPVRTEAALSFNLGTSISGSEGDEITIEARATDRDGFRVRDVPVTFRLSNSDAGSLSVSSGDTGTNGVLRTTLTLGDEDGQLTATAPNYRTATASITIEPAPADLQIVSGSGQTGTPGSTLSSPFVVRFEDTDGDPIPNVEVTFTVETGGGSLSDDEDTTDSDGEAETTLTLGSVGMRNTVRASVDVSGVGSVTFTAEAERPAEAVIIAGGNDQVGQVGRLLDEDLSVQVVNSNDDGVGGILVRFRITEGRGRLSRNSDRTDPDGYAEIGFTPTADGEAVVEAYSTGLASAFFTINTGDPPADILKVSGDNQSGRPGSRLANPFIVEVVDRNDDPVSGVTVTFAVTAGGGTLSTTTATTNGTGRTQTYLRLGDEVGENTVVARVSGLSDRVTFTARTGAEVLVSAAQRPPMYWISRTEGKLHRLVDAEVENLAPNIDGVLSLTVDTQNQLLYWTRQTAKSKSAIQRAGLNGRGVITLQTSLTLMTSIAVDSTGTTLYWADILGKIKSRPVQGNRVTLLAQNLSAPTGLVWANDYLYWGEATGQIRRMNLRNNRRTIETIATSSGEPVSLAVQSGRVYWTEISGNAAQLNRVNTNGTGLEALKTLVGSRRVWLDVDGSASKLYLTRASKLERRGLSGRSTVTLVSGLASPGSLVLGGELVATPPVVSQPTQPTQPTDNSKYDVNGDGTVDLLDVIAPLVQPNNMKNDVNGDGVVDIRDTQEIDANRDATAAAPSLDIDVKALDLDFDRVQEQIETLLTSGDMSHSTQRALLYLQHLLASARPDETVLLANYPNPFNPETWIPYHLSESTDVRVNIYDSQGVLVRVLSLGHQTAGYYTPRSRAAYWDGKNALGERVASGIYFYQLQTDAVSPMRKMVILK